MKKLVHIVIFERYREGAAYQENLLAQKHKELGFDVYIIAQQKSKDNNRRPIMLEKGHYVNDKGIDVTILESTRQNVLSLFFCDATRGLYNRLVEIAPDVIFVHNFTRKDVRHIVRYAKGHPNVEVYADCHSDYYNVPVKTIYQKVVAAFRRHWGKKILSVAKVMWGTTPWRVQYMQDVYGIPPEKTGLLIMGAEEKYIAGRDKQEIRKSIRSKYGIPEDAFLVVTGGTLDKRKQQNLLMEAVRSLADKNVWLLVFGSPTTDMESVFEVYKDEPNIVMTGWIPSEQAYDMFFASDLAFFPGTHSVLWEQAVACSCPIVTKHWAGMEHVNYNGNAVFMDEVDVERIRQMILRLNKTDEYDKMLSQAKDAAPHFFLDEIARKAIGL